MLCGVLVACTRNAEVGLHPGDRAPALEAQTLSPQGFQLSEIQGKFVLIHFWASWCEPCIAELPALERLYNRFKSRGFIVVGVGIDDSAEELLQFKERFGLTFPILLDTNGETKQRFKLGGVPETFFLDRAGKLMLLSDPDGGIPTVRFTGPREWDSPDIIAQLEALL